MLIIILCCYTYHNFLLLRNIIIIRAFCPRAGPSLQTQEPRPQLCSKAGLPPQTQEPTLQILLGMERCGNFPLLSAPHYLFSIWTDFKRSEKIPGAPAWKWGEWIWLTGPSGLHRNSPQGLKSVPSGFLTRSEIRKSQSLWPYYFFWN